MSRHRIVGLVAGATDPAFLENAVEHAKTHAGLSVFHFHRRTRTKPHKLVLTRVECVPVGSHREKELNDG